ncbi:MAG: radical SAM protein, partial [Desulfobacterales bacterium]|nr:radical SAM protein [Desulfobacterales bacterium]
MKPIPKLSDYEYIFGPVPSRRLGISLGVDVMPPKTCTLNCVYCECGRTDRLTLKTDEYSPTQRICEELSDYLSTGPKLDYITFSGSGEPLLHSKIGEIIHFIKVQHPQYRVALLTNGTLCYQPRIQDQLSGVDLVKVSLDTVSEKEFVRLNRPHPGLELPAIIDGLISVRKVFQQQLWVEVFLVPGINDNAEGLDGLKKILRQINPDKVQVNTLDRPGAEDWVKPVDPAAVKEIAGYLSNAEPISRFDSKQSKALPVKDFKDRVLATIKRRPCTAEDISEMLDVPLDVVHQYFLGLIEDGEVAQMTLPRGTFYFKR